MVTSDIKTAQNLPPPRKPKPLRHVSNPLSNTRLSKLVYLLVFLSALLAAFYSWRVLVWKSDVGGWWNLALGRRVEGGVGSDRRRGDESVQDKINALAVALGVPSKELASAIAGAVRSYVPPASLTSIAKAEKTSVEAIFGGDEEEAGWDVLGRMETLVGMDEPPDIVIQD